MPSKPADGNVPVDVERIMRQGILRAALLDRKSIDSRSAHLLQRHDLLKNLRREAIHKDIRAILSDPSHRDRLLAEWGPLVFVKDKDQLGVIEVIRLLFDSNVAMRRSVLQYLDRGVDRLAPDVARILRENRKVLTAAGEWLPAAVRIHDAVSSDLLYNLAGVRQCLLQHCRDGLDDFVRRVICPTPQSAGAAKLPVWNATQQASEIEEGILAVVGRAGSLEEAIEQYYQRYGYLPLAPSLSVPRVVELWLEQRGATDGVWAEVWKWANDSAHPVKQYHAALVFLVHPELVPGSNQGLLWARVAAITSHDGGKNDQEHHDSRWSLMSQLVQHYCQYLASLWQGGDGEAIASFAWWISREVVAAIPAEAVAYMAEKILPPMMLASYSEHRFSHPSTKGSPLQYGTLFFESLWATSIVYHLGAGAEIIGRENIADADRIAITTELGGVLVIGFPRVSPGRREIYAFDADVMSSAARWIAAMGNQAEMDQFDALIQLDTQHAKPKDLLESTDIISQYPPALQVLVARLFHLAGYLEEISADDLWQRLQDAKWRRTVFEEGDVEPACVICDTLIEVLVRANPERAVHLPHFLAAAYEACAGDKAQLQRCECLLTFIIIASISTQTVSAVERLVQGRMGIDTLRQSLGHLRERLQWLMNVAQPASAGRIRPVLLAISRFP